MQVQQYAALNNWSNATATELQQLAAQGVQGYNLNPTQDAYTYQRQENYFNSNLRPTYNLDNDVLR